MHLWNPDNVSPAAATISTLEFLLAEVLRQGYMHHDPRSVPIGVLGTWKFLAVATRLYLNPFQGSETS